MTKRNAKWFSDLASKIADRSDEGVGETSKFLGALCDIISERFGPQEPGWNNMGLDHFAGRLCAHGDKRRKAASKARRRG